MNLVAMPVPVHDETLVSQMLRVAEANGLNTVQKVYRRIHPAGNPHFSTLLHRPTDVWINAASETTGIKADHLIAGTRLDGAYPSLRTWVPTVDYRISVYCPGCLSDDGAWRLSWLLPYARVCLIHELLLVDHRLACDFPGQLNRRWSSVGSTTRICAAPGCGPRWFQRPAIQATQQQIWNHEDLLELETFGVLRLVGSRTENLPTGPTAPRVVGRRRVRSRLAYEPAAFLEYLDRPQ